jgi:hypothetical protein
MRDHTRYIIVFVVVLALQYASFGLHYANFAYGGHVVLPLVIAAIMVALSAIFFMELDRAPPAARIVALLGVLFIALLCLGVAGDVALR